MKLILAADENWAIGYKGGLLCHLSADLKYFKKMTTGHAVVMGRRTLESLPGKKGFYSFSVHAVVLREKDDEE